MNKNNKTGMIRDNQIDIYRALSIMLVVGVCHVCYWLKLGSEPFISIILIEMPIIFFISGASLSINDTQRSILTVIKKRVRRVVLPFYIYAFVVILFFVFMNITWPLLKEIVNGNIGDNATNRFSFDITAYNIRDIVNIMLCQDVAQTPMTWHLWFIGPYFLLSIIFEPQKRIVNKLNKDGALFLSIGIYLFSYFFLRDTIFNTLTAYNIFMVIGFLFYKKISTQKMVIGLVIFAAVTVLLLFGGFNFCPMQENKFPPNPLFISYNICVLCILGLIFSKTKIRNCKIFNVYNKRGYTIYLYQNIVFFFILNLRSILEKLNTPLLEFLIISTTVLMISYCLSFVTYRIECTFMRLIRYIS